MGKAYWQITSWPDYTLRLLPPTLAAGLEFGLLDLEGLKRAVRGLWLTGCKL